MVVYNVRIIVTSDYKIFVSISRNRKFYDEAEFNHDELEEFISFMQDFADEIARKIRKELYGD